MSALDGWIDVCRTGAWRDMAGREVAIDEARLDRIAGAHASADPAPVVVGHPETDAPAFAWVDGLRRTGDRLQAKLRDVAPAFREAVEAGRYAGRSIALQGDTLRHVGFLGGRAPAVPGLAPTRFAAEPETVIAFAGAAALARATAEHDEARPILAAPETMTETDHDSETNRQEGAMPKDEAALDEQKAEQGAREATLATQSVALPEGDGETLTFAAPDGNGQVHEAPAAVLEGFLAGLPQRVRWRTARRRRRRTSTTRRPSARRLTRSWPRPAAKARSSARARPSIRSAPSAACPPGGTHNEPGKRGTRGPQSPQSRPIAS